MVHSYHFCSDVWEKKLEAQQGQDNPVDKFAVMVVKENEAVSHFPQVFS